MPSVNTMGAGLKTVDDHLAALATAAEAAVLQVGEDLSYPVGPVSRDRAACLHGMTGLVTCDKLTEAASRGAARGQRRPS